METTGEQMQQEVPSVQGTEPTQQQQQPQQQQYTNKKPESLPTIRYISNPKGDFLYFPSEIPVNIQQAPQQYNLFT